MDETLMPLLTDGDYKALTGLSNQFFDYVYDTYCGRCPIQTGSFLLCMLW